MIPFIDNIEYNGPKPNFERDCMLWDKMQTVTDNSLDKGHIVYCIDPIWKSSKEVTSETQRAIQVETIEELELLRYSKPLQTAAWVTGESSGFILEGDGEHAGHYVFQGMKDNAPSWIKIINEDGSIAGELEIGNISNEYINSLDENL